MSQPQQQSTSTTSRGSTRVSRRVDYAVAVALNLVILFIVNAWPTWRAVPFVTDEAVQAVAILNGAAITAIVLNLVCLVVDRRWMKALTEFVNAGFSLFVAIELWNAFPFEFPDGSFSWALIARFAIVVAIVGSVVGMIVQFILVIVHAARDRGMTA